MDWLLLGDLLVVSILVWVLRSVEARHDGLDRVHRHLSLVARVGYLMGDLFSDRVGG